MIHGAILPAVTLAAAMTAPAAVPASEQKLAASVDAHLAASHPEGR